MISAGPARARRHPGLGALALAAALVAALAAVVVGAHVQPDGHGKFVVTGHYHLGDGAPLTAPPRSAHPFKVQPNTGLGIAGVVLFTAYVLLALAIVIVVIRFLLRLLRRWRRTSRMARVAAGELAAPDLVEQMTAAVDEAIAALDSDGPAADAIIECWQRLMAAAEQAGVPPLASDTPQETINRVFGVGQVHAVPLRALAELYREARFSKHPMGAAEVSAARAALTLILDDLRQARSAVG
ncbi:MAG TPA: DUF4129 domain-containing protein [Jatrophihabitans sp.]|jgi:hypothetical protein